MPVALITGGSAGLGLALATELAGRGWTLVIDARNEDRLTTAAERLRAVDGKAEITTIAGDVADPEHRARLAETTADGLALLVNNASRLGNILGAEEDLRVYSIDPGDMRTELHQLAFPGEDISDRPEAGSVVPRLLKIIDERLPSGRYRA